MNKKNWEGVLMNNLLKKISLMYLLFIALLLLIHCQNGGDKMGVEKRLFGEADGKPVHLYSTHRLTTG